MIKVGVIGLGHMGLLHLRNTRFIDGIQVIAVADKSKKALSEAKAYGIKGLYSDYEKLFELKDLDAVIISLPHFLHKESAVHAAESGLHIFIEKPLARSVLECKEIKEAVQKNNVKLVIGHNYRFFDHVKKLKAELEKGSIGDIEIASIEHFSNGPFAHPLEPRPIQDWWLDVKLAGGGVLLDDGSHLIDLFSYFFPDPELLYANLGYHYNLSLEDSAVLVLRSRSTSTKGIISMGWFQKMIFPQFNFRINLQGTAKFLSTDHFVPKNLYFHGAKAGIKNGLLRISGRKIAPLSYTYYYASYFEELQHFFQNINSDDEPNPVANINDGLKAIGIIEEAYQFSNKKTEYQI